MSHRLQVLIPEELDARILVEVYGPLVPAGGRAVHAEPEQLVEPLLPIARAGRVAFRAAEVIRVENADGEHLAVLLDEAPSGADPVGLGVGGLRPVVVHPELGLARPVVVAELEECHAAGADLERAAFARAALRRVERHVTRDRPAGQGLLAVERPQLGLLALGEARDARCHHPQRQSFPQHGYLLSPRASTVGRACQALSSPELARMAPEFAITPPELAKTPQVLAPRLPRAQNRVSLETTPGVISASWAASHGVHTLSPLSSAK